MTRLTRSDVPVEHVASTPIAVPTGEPGPLVTAPAGPVRGVWRRIVSAPDRRGDAPRFERSAAFYGIPYAEAPIGARRFMAPVPRARWAEERIGAAQAQGAEGSGFAATRSDNVCRARENR